MLGHPVRLCFQLFPAKLKYLSDYIQKTQNHKRLAKSIIHLLTVICLTRLIGISICDFDEM